MTAKTWTVNAIQDANRAAGGHWFDPDTMRTFGTEVLPTVYQGPGGVYFVTKDDQFRRELPKRYTVRSFDPETGGVDTVGDLNGYADAGDAKDQARGLAGRGGQGYATVAEPYRAVSVLEQFVADLHKHGRAGVTEDDADQLVTLARKHHRLMEKMCNGELATDSEGESKTVKKCRAHVALLARHVGAESVLFSGDPRGCTVKLTFKDGFTNDFAKEGYCVPTSTRDDD